jgi:hypothetical protein
MKPSKNASRASCLVMNPRNREASAARREKLLAAFESLPEDTRADLLELVETWVSTGSSDPEKIQPRAIIRQMYAIAGWETP